MNTMLSLRRNWIIAEIVAAALVVYGVGNPSINNGNSINEVEGDAPAYSMTFSSTNNRFSNSGDVATDTALTTSGSAIMFTYMKLTQTEGSWETLRGDGGYFYNNTPISGLHTISFVFGNDNPIKLLYGWKDRTSGSIRYITTAVDMGNTFITTYSFLEFPDCFRIDNPNPEFVDVVITSFTLTYSCTYTPDPIISTPTVGLQYEFVPATSTYSVIGYSGTTADVTIPSHYLGYEVAAIGNAAFKKNESMTTINLPSTLTSIGNNAFETTFLTSITIPINVTSIGSKAFFESDLDTLVTIPSSVTSIGLQAFGDCFYLPSFFVELENLNYSSDANGVLYNKDKTRLIAVPSAASIDPFTIPSGVTTIGTYSFANSVIPSIIIPSSVTTIEDYAFYFCYAYSITIPNGVISIGANAFELCGSLQSIELPNSVTSLGNYAFSSSGIQSFNIPAGITTIGVGTFQNCQSLETIIIPSNITSIGDYAFQNCWGLAIITIPSTVITMGIEVFFNCYPSLFINCDVATRPEGWSVNWHGNLETGGFTINWGWNDNLFSFDDSTDMASYVVTGYTGTFTKIAIPSRFDNKDVTEIMDSAFSENATLESILIPSSINTIGTSVFIGCSSLVSIFVQASNTTFSSMDGVLYDINMTTLITCPSDFQTGTGSFIFPESVTAIGDDAFSGCANLTSIIIPISVTTIGDWAFASCYNLTSIYIPDSVASMGSSVFVGCDLLIINCQATSRPGGWNANWNPDPALPVNWNVQI